MALPNSKRDSNGIRSSHPLIGTPRKFRPRVAIPLILVSLLAVLGDCHSNTKAAKTVTSSATPNTSMPAPKTEPHPGQPLSRTGDEIMVAGQLFHTGAPVILWTDPGGYDAYRTDRRFAPPDKASWEETVKQGNGPATPNRYGERVVNLPAAQLARIHDQGWDLQSLQQVVDQFVIHYDVAGTSRNCFRVLQDVRGLSVHFMIDIDGTIYQTLDVKERAWHATICNDRSVGVELANIGAYTKDEKAPFDRWYAKDAQGRTAIHVPSEGGGSGGVRTPGFIGHPSGDQPVTGVIQGKEMTMYDFTPEQYASLTRLTATLCTVLPKIRCDYPKDADGKLITHKLSDEELAKYTGLIGHYHIQENKTDPGPALQWERLVNSARAQTHP